MSRLTLSRAAPWRIGVASVAVAAAVTVAGATAVGALSGTGGGQPAPGSPGTTSDAEPIPVSQPPAGAPGVAGQPSQAQYTQPVNLRPHTGPSKPTQIAPDEPDAKPHLGQVDDGTAVSGPDQGD